MQSFVVETRQVLACRYVVEARSKKHAEEIVSSGYLADGSPLEEDNNEVLDEEVVKVFHEGG